MRQLAETALQACLGLHWGSLCCLLTCRCWLRSEDVDLGRSQIEDDHASRAVNGYVDGRKFMVGKAFICSGCISAEGPGAGHDRLELTVGRVDFDSDQAFFGRHVSSIG